MVLKTFNLTEEVYKKFYSLCKENGMSMSKQVEMFMKSVTETEPEAKKEFLERLAKIRKGKFIRVENFAERYGL